MTDTYTFETEPENRDPGVVDIPAEAKPKSKPKSTPRRRTSGSADRTRRSVIVETIAKMAQVLDADEAQRSVAASILGCDDDAEALTIAILTSSKGTRAVDDLMEIADADDQLEAGIAASMLAEDKGRLASAWALAHSLGLITSAAPDATGAKAAAALGRAALELDSAQREALAATVELIG